MIIFCLNLKTSVIGIILFQVIWYGEENLTILYIVEFLVDVCGKIHEFLYCFFPEIIIMRQCVTYKVVLI